MFLAIIGFLSLFLSISANNDVQLTSAEAERNIKIWVASVLIPNNHTPDVMQEINKFAANTSKLVLEKLGTKTKWYRADKKYKEQELRTAVIEEIIKFIEDSSKVYAQEDIQNFFVPSFVKKEDCIARVSQEIAQQTLLIAQQAAQAKQDLVLTHYIGEPLKTRVHDAIKLDLHFAQGNPRPIPIATEKCPSCAVAFDQAKLTRSYLSCGHNVCPNCIQKFTQSKSRGKFICGACGQ
jgi:hypothetical protein